MENEKWEIREWGNGEMEWQRTVGVRQRSVLLCKSAKASLARGGRPILMRRQEEQRQ